MTQQYPPQPPPYGQQPPQWQGYQAPPPVQTAPKKRRKWPWIVGAILLLFVVIGVAGGGNKSQPAPTTAAGSTAAAPTSAAQAAATGDTVTYEVTGSGRATITYTKQGGSIEQVSNAKLPWKKDVQFTDGVGAFSGVSLTVTNGMSGGDSTCRILVGGQEKGTGTASGQFATATCNTLG